MLFRRVSCQWLTRREGRDISTEKVDKERLGQAKFSSASPSLRLDSGHGYQAVLAGEADDKGT